MSRSTMTNERAADLRKLLVARNPQSKDEKQIHTDIFDLLEERAQCQMTISDLQAIADGASSTMEQIMPRIDLMAKALEAANAALTQISSQTDDQEIKKMIEDYFSALIGVNVTAND